MSNVNVARGMRDLLPDTMKNRRWVIRKLESVFIRYGFAPIETPAVERIETLTGKYGDEGGKLIFKILSRGEAGLRGECDLALRYDLTVPLARVMAMNQQIKLPFKRYQIQPVWRAERPQRGRFREFFQCDVDIIGTDKSIAESECLAVVYDSLKALGFNAFTIRLNDRRLLNAMVREIGALEQEFAVIGIIDKLDKIGREGVAKELGLLSISESAIDDLFRMLDGGEIPNTDEIQTELLEIVENAKALGVSETNLKIDRTLARGIDYYTGPVFETVLDDEAIGSVSGGGRYDGLIGMFSGKDVPAVGVSLGLERLITILEERNQFDSPSEDIQVMVSVFSKELCTQSLTMAKRLREEGIRTSLSFRFGKLGKQFRDANQKNIPYVIIIGPDDALRDIVQIKELATGEQIERTREDGVLWLKEQLTR